MFSSLFFCLWLKSWWKSNQWWDVLQVPKLKSLTQFKFRSKMLEIKPKLQWMLTQMTSKFSAKAWEKYTWSMDPKNIKLLLTIFPLVLKKDKSSDYLESTEQEKQLLSKCWLDKSLQQLVKVTSKEWKSVIISTKWDKILVTVLSLMLSFKT